METTSDENKMKAIRLIDYLTRLASLRTKVVRDLIEYTQVLWIHEIPKEKGCFAQAWGAIEEYDQDIWIEIQSSPEPELPAFPDSCSDWVKGETIRRTSDLPELHNTITKQVGNPAWQEGAEQPQFISETFHLEKFPEVRKAWERYVEQKWMPWAEQYEKWKKVQHIYSALFAIHQEQLRLGEEYELLLGMGLLTWQAPSNQRVRRHLVVANALLEFEARLGKFTVRPNPDGANLRPELDMLDIEEQPARAEEYAKANLKNAADDPWSKDCIEGVLKTLVHSIHPNGEYYPRLHTEKSVIAKGPIVEYSPALILRKRSAKGLTDILKLIKERIEREGEIPPEFGDLAEIPKNDGREYAEDQDDSNTQMEGDIYFPKPSNEEQRRIVEKIRASNGVLVQGPPGTGKSHTIANLICHLLATGQRILVTAKTPRALQVLMGRNESSQNSGVDHSKDDKQKGLIPSELRPLCINLLGSGLEEKRSLEASVNTILQKNELWNEIRTEAEIKKLEESLHRQREEKAGIENRLRAICESEAHIQTVADGAYRGTAAQIARAVARGQTKYNWFIDKVPFNKEYPLSEVDFIQLLKQLQQLTPEKKQELSRSWLDSIQSVAEFKNIIDTEQQAAKRERTASTDLDVRFLEQISSLPAKEVLAIREYLESVRNEIKRLNSIPYTWICDAVRDLLSGNGLWQELHKVCEEIIDGIGNIVGKADAIEVVLLASQDPRRVLQDALTLKEYLANGGKMGWGPFIPKVAKTFKYILKTIRVNGGPCNNLERVTALVDVLRVKTEMKRGWNFWVGRSERVKGPYSLQFRAFKSLSVALSEIVALPGIISQCREALAKCGNFPEPVWYDESRLDRIIRTCVHALAREEAFQARMAIEQLEAPVVTLAASPNVHRVINDLLQAIRTRNLDEYTRAHKKVMSLNDERKSARWLTETLEKVEQFTPHLANDLSANSENACWDERLRVLPETWRWAQARSWLNDYVSKEDTPSLERRQRQLEDDIGKTIARLASLHAWSFCFRRMKEEHRRHMEAWRWNMGKVTKIGTGKRDYRLRREAQKHLSSCREAVPAWVMPLHRVWDTVDPAPGMFDVIIVDEASQCGFEALPLLYLGKKILIVGDDKQISPDAVGIPRDAVSRLIGQYLFDFTFNSSFDVDGSLFDQGKLRYGTRRIPLREHFRCMPEIIRFSNDLCYSDTPLTPLRQYPPNRLVPLVHVYVQNGYREGSDSRVINRPEAEAIVSKVVELCRDEKYKGKTMGVVVLQGDAQAGLIEEQLLDRLGAEEMEQRRLICGNPYSFQGDERDIMVLSMVAAPNKRIGPLTMSADERRFNVAASRARDQMWLFHSVTRDDLSTSCLRRRLLEFFEAKPVPIPGINIQELSGKAEQANRSIEKPPQPFDSWFEVDVAQEIAAKNYRIVPQFKVAGKRIDLVIEGGHARLAVECDGDEFHGPEQYEQDNQRQRVLERCGWVFYRVRASGFYADREGSLAGLWRMLEERGITPQSNGPSAFNEQQSPTLDQKESDSCISDSNVLYKKAEHHIPTDARVEVGDTVLYVDVERPDNEKQALITRERSNPEWGTVSANTPIAQALLGGRPGEVVEAKLPKGSVRLLIKRIQK